MNGAPNPKYLRRLETKLTILPKDCIELNLLKNKGQTGQKAVEPLSFQIIVGCCSASELILLLRFSPPQREVETFSVFQWNSKEFFQFL